MLDQIQNKILFVIPNLNPLISVSITIIASLYIFWKLCSRTRKNNSSVFDTYFIGSIFSILFGRIAYIISNYSDFNKYIWYWLPYEKYGDEIFLFRLLPWRFFRIWDLGLEVLFLCVGLLIGCTYWVIFGKKWKWSHLYIAIYASGYILLLLSIIGIGKFTNNTFWFSQGIIMLILFLVWSLLRSIFIKVIIGIKEMKILLITDTIFIVLSSLFVIRMYMLSELSLVEKMGIMSFIAWTSIGLFYHITDTNKATVVIEKVSSVRQVSVNDIRQQIRSRK